MDHVVPDVPDLLELFGQLNGRFFEDKLPPCQVRWSRRLTRTAGMVYCEERLIDLSYPLLVEQFRSATLFPPEYLVCGVPCQSAGEATTEILKHEMLHFWLYCRGEPPGHPPLFKHLAHAMGQSSIRHCITLPKRPGDWVYQCPHCGYSLHRRRRMRRQVACGLCCRKYNQGEYDRRFQFQGRQLLYGQEMLK